jgi:hypothetical protein
MDEIKGLVTNGQIAPEWKAVTVATSLAAYERLVAVNTGAAGDYIITLPPMADCVGRGFYVIKVTTHGASDVTVESPEKDGGGKLYTSGKLTALADFLILWTDGERWYEIKELTT